MAALPPHHILKRKYLSQYYSLRHYPNEYNISFKI